jgi:hypothetical protein
MSRYSEPTPAERRGEGQYLTRKLRSMTAIFVAVSAAVLLTSCFPGAAGPTVTPSEAAAGPGLSHEAAVELLNAVPGLSSADVGSQISGVSTEAVMEVTVDDEASILADGVLDYVVKVGWATELPNEPTQLSLSVWSNGTLLELQDEANALVGEDYPAFPLIASVHLDAPAYLGSWPGAVPTPPVG